MHSFDGGTIRKKLQEVARWISSSETAQNSGILFGCRVATMATRIIISPLTASMLGTAEYGTMSFALNIIAYLQIIFTLGLDSAPRLAAQSEDSDDQRRLVGTYLLLFLIWGVLLGVLMWAAHGWVDAFFSVKAGALFGQLAPIIIILPISVLTEYLLRGLGRIRLLGIATLVPALLYLAGVLWLSLSGGATATSVLYIRYLTITAVQIVVLFALRPRFSGLTAQVRRIWLDFLSFGRRVYTGRVVGSLASCSQIVLGYFVSAETIAYYNIALALSGPIELVGSSYAQTLYRGMMRSEQLHPQQRRTSVLVSLAAAVSMPIAGTVLIFLVYPADFYQAIPFLFIVSAGRAFRGAYALYTQYLSSHGAGDIMRRVCLIGAGVELTLTVLLIYLFGAFGAAVAVIIINGFNLGQYLVHYRRIVRALSDG